ncbi:MAG: alkaline phosphatase family protein [Vulcanimicrobiota bacterium]
MRYYLLFLVVLALTLSLSFLTLNAAPVSTNAVLIGWDGAQRDHVKEAMARGELPALKRLSAEGAMVDIDIRGVTDTNAGWAQILTGYYPEISGVYSNRRYRPIPEGYTIFERLSTAFGAENITTAAVMGGKGGLGINGPDPGNPKNLYGKPYHITKEHVDLFQSNVGSDGKVCARAMELLNQYQDERFFLFVYFADVDHNGHKHGENSKEYNDALISSDRWTGRIVQKLNELSLNDRTLVYVTADHGFDEGQKRHRNAPCVFLATTDRKVKGPGHREDITPTILNALGVDLKKIEPPLSGRPLNR